MNEVEATYRRLLEGIYNEPQADVLEDALIRIALNPAVKKYFPAGARIAEHLREASQDGDPSVKENSLIALYHRLHAAGARYKDQEEDALDTWNGLGCIPSGLLPLFFARHFVRPDSLTADLGAGNGLQGLLIQALCPHRQTLLVEISENLVETGRRYQQALGISNERILWENGDIADTDLREVDLVYLYRPGRPQGDGKLLYKIIAEKLAESSRFVIYSLRLELTYPKEGDRG
ncbi:MAG: hypothetical protein KGY56_11670 [Desulfobacterales bacterium]|nr:hypothetical protein [Desulfobacterales bacterium]